MNDVDTLHKEHDAQQYADGLQLFQAKWIHLDCTLLEYFNSEWVQKNPNWYEGAMLFALSTNNALEATNRVIKEEFTKREREFTPANSQQYSTLMILLPTWSPNGPLNFH